MIIWNCTIVLSFFVYSFLGWLWESTVCSLHNEKQLINRGFLLGPLCPIYGAGALCCYFALYYVENPTRQYIIKIDKEGPKVTYENTENGENGSKESIEKVKVRPTVVDEAGVENSALKYSWVKFESVEKYNEFQKAEKTIEKLKEKWEKEKHLVMEKKYLVQKT